VQWLVFIAGVAVISALWLGPIWHHIEWINIDQAVYDRTIELMRNGAGYYPSMARALTEYLDAPALVTEFRTPTVFWLWQWTGIPWPLAYAVIVACGVLVSRLSWPIAGLGVTFWLTVTSHTTHGAQWAYNETWALLFVLLGIWAFRRDRRLMTVVAVLTAALIRETAAVALVGGLCGALAGWIA
jgi:hypothetical protein